MNLPGALLASRAWTESASKHLIAVAFASLLAKALLSEEHLGFMVVPQPLGLGLALVVWLECAPVNLF
jgi:hypothetical protein